MRRAGAIAASVRAGRESALALVEACLATLPAADASLVAVTRILADRARAEAARVDGIVAAGGLSLIHI